MIDPQGTAAPASWAPGTLGYEIHAAAQAATALWIIENRQLAERVRVLEITLAMVTARLETVNRGGTIHNLDLADAVYEARLVLKGNPL